MMRQYLPLVDAVSFFVRKSGIDGMMAVEY